MPINSCCCGGNNTNPCYTTCCPDVLFLLSTNPTTLVDHGDGTLSMDYNSMTPYLLDGTTCSSITNASGFWTANISNRADGSGSVPTDITTTNASTWFCPPATSNAGVWANSTGGYFIAGTYCNTGTNDNPATTGTLTLTARISGSLVAFQPHIQTTQHNAAPNFTVWDGNLHYSPLLSQWIPNGTNGMYNGTEASILQLDGTYADVLIAYQDGNRQFNMNDFNASIPTFTSAIWQAPSPIGYTTVNCDWANRYVWVGNGFVLRGPDEVDVAYA